MSVGHTQAGVAECYSLTVGGKQSCPARLGLVPPKDQQQQASFQSFQQVQHMQELVCVEQLDDGNGNGAGALDVLDNAPDALDNAPDALDNALGLDTSALDANVDNGTVATRADRAHGADKSIGSFFKEGA